MCKMSVAIYSWVENGAYIVKNKFHRSSAMLKINELMQL